MSLLEVKNLVVEFPNRRGTLRALDDISFDIAPGEILGVVGESGAGKSLTGASIIGLLEPPGRVASGEILLEGRRIDNLPPEQMRQVRGRQIGAIFQDPLTSLNPLYSVGRQLIETITTHLPVSQAEARQRAIQLLRDTGIPAPEQRIDHFPHQFSGGMRQRVVIALALAAEPKLIVADEPTTALDVSIQAQIIIAAQDHLPRPWRGGDADHARHGRDRRNLRPRGRDVRRAHRRDRPGARGHQPARPPLHQRPDGLHSRHERGPRAPAPDRRRHAAPERHSARLCLQPALRPWCSTAATNSARS
jgi:ABC-type dipeptide/oligopeptide/nickel transport system ATPase subunit